jgi:hypothetical protein
MFKRRRDQSALTNKTILLGGALHGTVYLDSRSANSNRKYCQASAPLHAFHLEPSSCARLTSRLIPTNPRIPDVVCASALHASCNGLLLEAALRKSVTRARTCGQEFAFALRARRTGWWFLSAAVQVVAYAKPVQ